LDLAVRTIQWMVRKQRQASYGTPVAGRMNAPGQPMVKVCPSPGPSGTGSASGLCRPSTGRSALRVSATLDLAKTPISGAQLVVGFASLAVGSVLCCNTRGKNLNR